MSVARAAAGAALLLACGVALAFEGKVVHVQDGDTITVLVEQRQVKVRLASIDAPELGQPFGRASKDELASMCAGRIADVVETGRDRNGRTVAEVTCGGAYANAEQVRRGMAWVYMQYAPRGSPLYALEAEARATRRGLWSDRDPVAPWTWRQRGKAGSVLVPVLGASAFHFRFDDLSDQPVGAALIRDHEFVAPSCFPDVVLGHEFALERCHPELAAPERF